MRKILTISILIIILILGISINSYADSSFQAKLSTDTTGLKAGENVKIILKVYNINMGNGIMALSANLLFDENVFEAIEVNNLGGVVDESPSQLNPLKNWSSPSYSPNTKKMAIDASKFITSDCDVIEMILKVKENINVKETTIKLTEVMASNGEEDIPASDISITIKSDNTSEDEKNNGNNDNEKNNNINDNEVNDDSNNSNTVNNNSINGNNIDSGNGNNNNGSNSNRNNGNVNNNNGNNSNIKNTTNNSQNTNSINYGSSVLSRLPKAGKNGIIIVILIFLAVIATCIFYKKYNKINKNIK